MARQETLAPHPRLYASRAQIEGLRRRPRLKFLQDAARQVASRADQYAKAGPSVPLPGGHNQHLRRAFAVHVRVVALLVQWLRSGEERYRGAVLDMVREMAGWEHWSWMAWRDNDPRPEAVFDLSYGANSFTLAVAFDWMFGSLSEGERELFRRTARERALRPFLFHVENEQWPHWFAQEHSNWNGVCAGGAGLLALAMHDELPEAREALPLVESSLDPFMRCLEETDGGWTEGIGYWNFGMRYALSYLLSHERTMGRRHPLLRLPSTKRSLAFPLDFCPNGVPCSFGDSNHWVPVPIHHAAAARLNRPDVQYALDLHLRQGGVVEGQWSTSAEWLLLHSGRAAPKPRRERGVVKMYRGMDWGIIADRMPAPRVCLAVRGGTTKVFHGHRDLLSYHCVVGDEALISSIGVDEYLDTTFSPRRNELFETGPLSKNVILINGVGIAEGSSVASEVLRCDGVVGIRMDATEAMGQSRGEGPAAQFCGRAFLMLDAKAFLIVDRVEMPFEGRVESRAHTYAEVAAGASGADLTGERHRMRVACACSAPASFHTALTAPTTPGRPANVLRWCTDGLHTSVTMATLLSPGAGTAEVQLEEQGSRVVVSVRLGRGRSKVTLTRRLRFPRARRAKRQ